MRLIFRILAIWALGVSVFLAVLDIAKSIGFSAVIITSLTQIWQDIYPELLHSFAHFIRTIFSEYFWENWLEPVLAQPGWLLFLILAFLLYICGHRSRRKGRAA